LGTLQKQVGAEGIYFGRFPAANDRWFATFHYYNHWGAFAVLHAAIALSLVFYSLKKPPARGWSFGPGPLLAIAALLIAATAPLSASRSATGLMAVLGLTAVVFAARHVLAQPKRSGGARRSRRLSRLLALSALLVGGGAFIVGQSREVFSVRIAQTVQQFSGDASWGLGYGRSELYADTWRMAADAPVFGWGLEAYGRVFLRYCTFRPGSDGLMNTYVDAHSDWLQSLAEVGFVGTALLVLLALAPVWATVRGRKLSALPAWLLAGCGLVVCYAAIEFPLANPAVVATWWIMWAVALRFLQLTPSASGPDPARPCSPSSS
jgi:O-antigen ligase